MKPLTRKSKSKLAQNWLWENLSAVAKNRDNHAAQAIGPMPRTPSGRIREATFRVAPKINHGDPEALCEFWKWLYIDQPFKGHWSALEKGAGLEGTTFIFSLFEDSLIMRLRWGSWI